MNKNKAYIFAATVLAGFAVLSVFMLGLTKITDKREETAETVITVADTETVRSFAGTEWPADNVENTEKIGIIFDDREEEGLLVNFIGSSGYMLIDEDLTVYAVSSEGEPPNPGDDGRLVFVNPYGFFIEKDGELLPLEEDSEDYLQELENLILGGADKSENCGKIADTDAYMQKNFGDGWTLTYEKSLDVEGFTQKNLSCYETVLADGTTQPEGNCWVTAPFMVLQYFAENPFPLSEEDKYIGTEFPSAEARVPFIPEEDEPKIYGTVYDSEGNNISKLIKNDSGDFVSSCRLIYDEFDFPLMWADMRRVCNALYGEIENGTVKRTRTLLDVEAGRFSLDLKTKLKQNTFYGRYLAVKSIDRGIPFVFVTDSGTYGAHTMAACGYRIYTREKRIWRFKFIQHKYFFEVLDGYSITPVYYDVSSYSGKGGIILIEVDE